MAPSKKSSTSRPKPSKGRPLSTSEISQSTLANTLPILSSFSLDGSLFAIITLSVDKHRLRVYNTTTGRALAEHTVESPRVSALTWAVVKLSSGTSGKEPSSPSKRKKKRVDSDVAVDEGEGLSTTTTVVLGLSNGAISFFSPSQSRIVRTLSASASTSSIVSMAIGPDSSTLWTSGADGTLRLWNIDKNEILSSWKNDDCIPYTSLSLRPTNDRSRMDILAAHHHIQILSATTDAHNPTTRKPTKLASFTGHASSVKSLCWENADISNRFFSAAEGDRFIYVWDFVEGSSSSENPLASVALDSDVRAITISPGLSKKTLVALSASGKLTFYPVPETFSPPPSAGDKIPTLLPRSTAATLPKGRTSGPPVIDLVSVPGDSGSIRVVRLVGGIRPVFDLLRYMDDDGNFIQNVTLEDVGHDPTGNALLSATNKRYVEPTSLAIGSGFDVGQDEDNDDSVTLIDGSLQVDLAELSLGQRLTAVTEGQLDQASDSDVDDPGSASRTERTQKRAGIEISVVPANSLTRTLIQALHSSDTRLLEMCLTHSDPTLIRNTVRRLPPQLAIPLITACVERLGRGARAMNMKGGGGGASSQRGAGLVSWVKAVLAIHAGHLMTIPDLVARLSGLHATLTARLNLHESLLSLSGRLDMVLSQIELRSSTAPTLLAPRGEKMKRANKASVVKRYVEGESESSNDEDMPMDVEIGGESDDEGSVEDIELGGDSDSEDDNDGSSESGDEGLSGFIDDEAEEEYSDEENEDESE